MDLLADLRNVAIGLACILTAAAALGFVIAEWRNMRDYEAGRDQPTPTWTAEDRWG